MLYYITIGSVQYIIIYKKSAEIDDNETESDSLKQETESDSLKQVL